MSRTLTVKYGAYTCIVEDCENPSEVLPVIGEQIEQIVRKDGDPPRSLVSASVANELAQVETSRSIPEDQEPLEVPFPEAPIEEAPAAVFEADTLPPDTLAPVEPRQNAVVSNDIEPSGPVLSKQSEELAFDKVVAIGHLYDDAGVGLDDGFESAATFFAKPSVPSPMPVQPDEAETDIASDDLAKTPPATLNLAQYAAREPVTPRTTPANLGLEKAEPTPFKLEATHRVAQTSKEPKTFEDFVLQQGARSLPELIAAACLFYQSQRDRSDSHQGEIIRLVTEYGDRPPKRVVREEIARLLDARILTRVGSWRIRLSDPLMAS